MSDYNSVTAAMALWLMKTEGWKVYGYHADESDPMTDYYSPAYWNGVATKNGYVLCVNVFGAQDEYIVYENEDTTLSYKTRTKIAKLKEMTTANGASEAEEQSALEAIKKLEAKADNKPERKIKHIEPAHMAHPPRCNWHIEKDGKYIDKGNGLLKFDYYEVEHYYSDPYRHDEMMQFRNHPDEYKEDLRRRLSRYNSTEEELEHDVERTMKKQQEHSDLIDKFEALMQRIDSQCGGILGEGDLVQYEKKIVTVYKEEVQVRETGTGAIKEGQTFILKRSFNNGCYKGLVYRIHEMKSGGYFYAYKLNKKHTKECTGMASANNHWSIGAADDAKFLSWISKGYIAWCELENVKVPYKVEKVVKKNKTQNNAQNTAKTHCNSNNKTTVSNEKNGENCPKFTYNVTKDVHTKTNCDIFVVKLVDTLDREEYKAVNKYMRSLGGYYSKFKHGFIFDEDPSDNITYGTVVDDVSNGDQEVSSEENINDLPYDYIIKEDINTKTKEPIWTVSFEDKLSKEDFGRIKLKFASMRGYYSTFKHAFIFKYNPTDKLNV